ncbi:MAG: type VI secretion system contractile sheath large subunit [Sandaracinaceae bacterium]
MATEQQDRGGAQVHWLVVGQFGIGPRGTTLALTRADFGEVLEKRGLKVRASVPDTIGPKGGTLEVELSVSSLKDLTLKNIVAGVPALRDLAGKADALGKLKAPTKDDLRGVVGDGQLLDELAAIIDPGTAAPASTSAPSGGDVDAIMAQAEVQKPTVKSAISAFVKASGTSSKPKDKPSARQLRDLTEQKVWSLAADVLNSPEVAAVERAWRGLRFFAQQCPKDAMMEIRILESDDANAVATVRDRARGESVDEPDCIFVPSDLTDAGALSELASLGEEELIPVVVGVGPALFGCANAEEVPDALEGLEKTDEADLPEWAKRWDELRLEESTRWLCCVMNDVALHAEGAGAAQRIVFGSGVWAVASMIGASYAATAGFARIFGKNGALSAPAVHTIRGGRYADQAAPTEAFYAIAAADTLAKNGVLGVSSARGTDQLVLLKAPCVRGAKDAVPLPAQCLTGRVVRFATWMAPQLPEGCDSATANELFESAATVFLFPGQRDAARVAAALTNIDGEAHVVVQAKANPAIASVPFDIAFPLPLHWSVPAQESAADAKPAEAKPAPAAKPEDGVHFAGGSVGFDVGADKKK